MKRSPALRKWHWQVKKSTYMRHWPSMSWGWQNNFDWYQHPFSLAESVPRMIHVSYARGFCTIFIWFCFKFLLYPIHRISSLIISKVATLPQMPYSLQWRHNERDGVSIHQPHECLLKRLFRCRSKKASKLHVTGLCVRNSPGPVNSPHKGPVTQKLFPFDDVFM